MDEKDRRRLVVGILILILFFINLIGEVMRDRTLRRWALTCLGIVGVGIAVLVFLFWFVFHPVMARDLGQWSNSDPAISQWYKKLMMPDMPNTPCCGEADAYWCDDYYARDGKAYCKITDDRDDAPLKRPHIDIGTEIKIPPHKLKHDDGNPTGHSILFVSKGLTTYCFVQNGGV